MKSNVEEIRALCIAIAEDRAIMARHRRETEAFFEANPGGQTVFQVPHRRTLGILLLACLTYLVVIEVPLVVAFVVVAGVAGAVGLWIGRRTGAWSRVLPERPQQLNARRK